MNIVKIDMFKVSANRDIMAKPGPVKVTPDVKLKNLDAVDVPVDGKKGVRFEFNFAWNYEPNIGSIEVGSQILVVGENDNVDEVLKSWKEKKEIPPKIMEKIINAGWRKGTLQAMKLSEEVMLPNPFPLPKVKASE